MDQMLNFLSALEAALRALGQRVLVASLVVIFVCAAMVAFWVWYGERWRRTAQWRKAKREGERARPGETPGVTPTLTFQLYGDHIGEYRWRSVHRNGNVKADSGEGYRLRGNRDSALRNDLEAIRRGDYRIVETRE